MTELKFLMNELLEEHKNCGMRYEQKSTRRFQLLTYKAGRPDGVQVGGVFCVLQGGQSAAELIVNPLSAVVVPLHVQQVSDRVNGCQKTQKRTVKSCLFLFLFHSSSGLIAHHHDKPRCVSV